MEAGGTSSRWGHLVSPHPTEVTGLAAARPWPCPGPGLRRRSLVTATGGASGVAWPRVLPRRSGVCPPVGARPLTSATRLCSGIIHAREVGWEQKLRSSLTFRRRERLSSLRVALSSRQRVFLISGGSIRGSSSLIDPFGITMSPNARSRIGK